MLKKGRKKKERKNLIRKELNLILFCLIWNKLYGSPEGQSENISFVWWFMSFWPFLSFFFVFFCQFSTYKHRWKKKIQAEENGSSEKEKNPHLSLRASIEFVPGLTERHDFSLHALFFWWSIFWPVFMTQCQDSLSKSFLFFLFFNWQKTKS